MAKAEFNGGASHRACDGAEAMTEYAFLVRSCSLPGGLTSESAENRGRVIAETLGTIVGALPKSLESFDDGGWQVLSHTLLEANDSLLVSFLICRHRQARITGETA